MSFYFDSSALTKRYIAEKGSEKLDALFLEADSVFVNSISFIEIISALSRLRREKKLGAHAYGLCKRSAIEDFSGFEVCQLTPEVLKRSVTILEHTELRAADALHVACALETKASRFISSDIRQLVAAKKFGLHVVSV